MFGCGNRARSQLSGIVVDRRGQVYFIDMGQGVRRIDAQGRLAVVLRAERPWSATAVAVGGKDLYVLEYLHTAAEHRRAWVPRVKKVSPAEQPFSWPPSNGGSDSEVLPGAGRRT